MFKNPLNVVMAYFNGRYSVDANTGCWLWGGVGGENYGTGCIKPDVMSAHRMAYKLFKGDIPDGLEIDHLCGQKRCVNPDHLEAVTHSENINRSKATMPTKAYTVIGSDDPIKAKQREWYEKNKERIKEKQREYESTKRARLNASK